MLVVRSDDNSFMSDMKPVVLFYLRLVSLTAVKEHYVVVRFVFRRSDGVIIIRITANC